MTSPRTAARDLSLSLTIQDPEMSEMMKLDEWILSGYRDTREPTTEDHYGTQKAPECLQPSSHLTHRSSPGMDRDSSLSHGPGTCRPAELFLVYSPAMMDCMLNWSRRSVWCYDAS